MGLFENIKKKTKMDKLVREYFKMINGYTPAFSTFEGGIYEMELTRAAIHSFATHVSKLKPESKGMYARKYADMMQFMPNGLMNTSQYLERIATEYEISNTAMIAPITDENDCIIGYYPLATNKCELVKVEGNTYIRYRIDSENYVAFELSKLGIMVQHQRNNEIFGESNKCLYPTLELINTQNQGIVEGVKSAAAIRFMARLARVMDDKDIEAERDNFAKRNLSSENGTGVMIFDDKYEEVKQIESKPFVVNAAQMNQIKENVFNYFGTNEAILQNKFTSDQWSAYYEGKIEPFAIKASLVHTNMTLSESLKQRGNYLMFTANRLQYMSNTEKLNTVTQMFDRGFLTHNQGLEVFNMAPVENGDKRYIRREYTETNNLDNPIDKNIIDDNKTAKDAEEGEKENVGKDD